jgi:hypothetical protein
MIVVAGCVAQPHAPVDDGRSPPPQACLDLPTTSERATCLVPYFEQLTVDESAGFAVCRAATLQLDGTIDDCHGLAHVVGAANYAQSDNAGEALATCGTGCIEGCLHGVMQEFVGGLAPEAAAITAEVAPLCDGLDGHLWYACVHGIGHGLRFHGLFDLLEALAICDAAGDAQWANVCAGGVYMEQVSGSLAGGLDSLGLLLPQICADLQGDPRQEHCIEAVGEGLMFATAHDLPASLDMCLRLAAADAIAWCQHGAEVEAEVNADVPPDAGC